MFAALRGVRLGCRYNQHRDVPGRGGAGVVLADYGVGDVGQGCRPLKRPAARYHPVI